MLSTKRFAVSSQSITNTVYIVPGKISLCQTMLKVIPKSWNLTNTVKKKVILQKFVTLYHKISQVVTHHQKKLKAFAHRHKNLKDKS